MKHWCENCKYFRDTVLDSGWYPSKLRDQWVTESPCGYGLSHWITLRIRTESLNHPADTDWVTESPCGYGLSHWITLRIRTESLNHPADTDWVTESPCGYGLSHWITLRIRTESLNHPADTDWVTESPCGYGLSHWITLRIRTAIVTDESPCGYGLSHWITLRIRTAIVTDFKKEREKILLAVFWWLVRVTSVVSWRFLPRHFGDVVGTYEGCLPFFESTWGHNSTCRFWGHPTHFGIRVTLHDLIFLKICLQSVDNHKWKYVNQYNNYTILNNRNFAKLM